MPACRFPPCFHRKSRRVNPAIPSAAFSMQIKYKRLSPHVPYTSPFSSAIFHAARTLSGSLRSPPSPRGEGFIRRYSFSSYVCIRSDVMGKAVFSYRSLPHWGRGTAPAVDRVLSYIACLRRSPSLSFIPLEPYPARFARHLPHAGKALCREKRYPRIVAFPIGEGFVSEIPPSPYAQ